MSSTNAPQPDAQGPAEVFDSTVGPPMGEVSADQGPGANTAEAPIHAGQNNGIDPFFYMHFVALKTFVWDTSATPGQMLWKTPIHPQFVHQFMAHLAKMYNVFAGGFDFSFTIAGTGFHAGKLLIVRLPPNVNPESLTTVQDITAFPYYIIDPKTLETIVKHAMDQRNVMYHYLPYDPTNPQTYGGWIACYVLLPLATSATGQTQISVQVLSKPSLDFKFSQVVPVKADQINPFKAEDLEYALDFRRPKSHPLHFAKLITMTANPGKEIKELTAELNNCANGKGEPVVDTFYPRFEKFNTYDIKRFGNVKTLSLEVSSEPDSATGFGVIEKDKAIRCFSYDALSLDPESDPATDHYPNFTCDHIMFGFRHTKDEFDMLYLAHAVQRKWQPNDDATLHTNVLEYQGAEVPYLTISNAKIIPANYVDVAMQKGDLTFVSVYKAPLKFDITYKPVAPPIEESIVTFQSEDLGETAQPYELTEALKKGTYASLMDKQNSIIFELIDDHVGLPLAPFRLHYAGYFTTISVSKKMIFKFNNPQRYYFRFIGFLPETTPMVNSRLPISSPQQYNHNYTISRIASSA